MIFCFSGTGNSRYIADRLAEDLKDSVLDLNIKIKLHDVDPVQTGRNVILVIPTYAWRIPRVVRWTYIGVRTNCRGSHKQWRNVVQADKHVSTGCYNLWRYIGQLFRQYYGICESGLETDEAWNLVCD